MLRGRTYAQLKQWNEAVEDLSAAIHLKPSNAKAFYYRACLLRKYAIKIHRIMHSGTSPTFPTVTHYTTRVIFIHLIVNSMGWNVDSNLMKFKFCSLCPNRLHPKKALQDYSVSVLLDDSDENILCYLHRAILYNEIGRYIMNFPLSYTGFSLSVG